MKKIRDMTLAQFEKQVESLGFKPEGFFGYYKVPNTNTCVSVYNAGQNRRAQLAYLIREGKRIQEEQAV